MKDRKAKGVSREGPLKIVGRGEEQALRGYFAEQGQVLLPLLELVQDTRASIDELMSDAARTFVEQLLVLSAQEVAGVKQPGKDHGEIRWHGSQAGRIVLAERQLAVKRPRLRKKGPGGTEIAVPVYERLKADGRLADRVRDILVTGVSTRKYERVLPKMAGTVGVSKSSVSREFIKASAASLRALMNRRFDDVDILVVYMDGIVIDRHHILAAVGVDCQGVKQILGVAPGSSENARVAKDLLNDLIRRGLRPESDRLFVIDGSKALRSAITEVFGDATRVQRCRTHKVRNVTERLPKDLAAQVKSVMHAAYKLPDAQGIAKLKQQASWLKTEHPDAAASLLEGLEETFTVNRMKLPPSLTRCLCTTNIIENPNGAVRRVSRRVCRYRNADMALRWTATGFLEAERSFRRIQGAKDLWILASALGRNVTGIDSKHRSA
jgi:putative transposase